MDICHVGRQDGVGQLGLLGCHQHLLVVHQFHVVQLMAFVRQFLLRINVASSNSTSAIASAFG